MTALPRRAFLGGLVRPPLIGGGVSLIGQPTATAEPVTTDLLMTYADWLFYERRILISELCDHDPQKTRWAEKWRSDRSDEFHFRRSDWRADPQPSSRAGTRVEHGRVWLAAEGQAQARVAGPAILGRRGSPMTP